jgi:hypothetical protein
MNLEIVKHIPAGTEGRPRGICESCGLHVWTDRGYRVPGLKGLFCSLVGIECGIGGSDWQRGSAAFLSENSGSKDLRLARAGAARLSARSGVWNVGLR